MRRNPIVVNEAVALELAQMGWQEGREFVVSPDLPPEGTGCRCGEDRCTLGSVADDPNVPVEPGIPEAADDPETGVKAERPARLKGTTELCAYCGGPAGGPCGHPRGYGSTYTVEW